MRKAKIMMRKLKDHLKKVLTIKTTPKEIALGFAVGTFISILHR